MLSKILLILSKNIINVIKKYHSCYQKILLMLSKKYY